MQLGHLFAIQKAARLPGVGVCITGYSFTAAKLRLFLESTRLLATPFP